MYPNKESFRPVTPAEIAVIKSDLKDVVNAAIAYWNKPDSVPRSEYSYLVYEDVDVLPHTHGGSFAFPRFIVDKYEFERALNNDREVVFQGVCVLGAAYCNAHPEFVPDAGLDSLGAGIFDSIESYLLTTYPVLENVVIDNMTALGFLTQYNDDGYEPESILGVLDLLHDPELFGDNDIHIKRDSAYTTSVTQRLEVS